MRRNYTVALGLSFLLSISAPLFSVDENSIAPKIMLFNLEGGLVNTHAFKEKKNLIISFFLVPCPPCVKEIPHLQKIQDAHAGIKVILVSDFKTDGKTAREFIEMISQASGTKISLPVILDRFGDATQLYKVMKHPTTFLINKKGIVVLRIDGYTEEKGELLRKKVESLDAE